MKQNLTELKRERESCIVMVGDFSTTFNNARTPDRINKEIKDLSNTINQLNLADTQTLPQQEQKTQFSQVNMDHSPVKTIGHKTNTFQKY